MPGSTIRIRAKNKNGVVTVKALITHPMESGYRKDNQTGKQIPAHYIKEVSCEHAGKTVMMMNWNGGISKDPYLTFKFVGARRGDSVRLTWIDTKGDNDSLEALIK